MFDPVSLLMGAALVAGGYGGGRIGRARRRPKPPRPIKPECGCGHHKSYHQDGVGACQERVCVSFVEGYKKCACMKYEGPIPLPEYYPPEIG
jgi:hypothetical protein